MASKPVFCFIDDADFELDNFRAHAASAFERVEFVCGRDLLQVETALEGRQPLCFLLDLYGTDPDVKRPRLPEPGDLARLMPPAPAAEEFYQGVEAPSGQGGNLFLRRLYAQVEGWQQVFLAACASLGQGRGYGLGNLAGVRRQYPWAACLAYSRKALYQDAAELSRAGVDGILQKPQGADDQKIARATEKAAPRLAQTAYRVVDRRLALAAGGLGMRLYAAGEGLNLAEALSRALEQLAPEADCTRGARSDAAQSLAEVRLEELGLAAQEVSLVLALREWLAA